MIFPFHTKLGGGLVALLSYGERFSIIYQSENGYNIVYGFRQAIIFVSFAS